MTSQLRFIGDRRSKGTIVTALLALSALSGCSLTDLPTGTDAASSSASPSAVSSSTDDLPSTTASEFSFPQPTCGDQATTPSENWYSVYIDNGSLESIRSKYCGDAVSTIRDKTGAPSVQVASFTSYGKAQQFATAVGGEVESVPTAQSTPTPSADRSASPSPTASSQASPQPSASPSTGETKTAVLAASESSSPINIRDSASTSSQIASVGYGGDRLQIVDKTQGEDGYTWYSVRLESGETGWVRGDFVSEEAASAAAGNTPAVTSSPAVTPSTGSASSGQAAAGQATAGQDATLSASEPGSPINVRARASTTGDVRSVGYAGDRVQIGDKVEGEDGYTWYSVRFESGETGWVRSDFINR
ncbi:SH3 domain-containing protein [Phormidium tenue FACHB-886]|nr:SH3 domain-containing protein [Phormidium tenue FACHB-886]